MCTSQGLLSKAHYGPLYLLNHAYDGVRCGAPTVTREAPLERQTIICSAKLYKFSRGRPWRSEAVQAWVSDCGDPLVPAQRSRPTSNCM